MDLDIKICEAFQRLEILCGSDFPSGEMAAKLVAELNSALAELEVTALELNEQNQELAASQQNLQAERQRYEELFDFAPDGYLITDAAGNITEANIAAANLFKVSKNFLIGNPMTIFIRGDARLAFRDILASLNEGAAVRHDNWEIKMRTSQRNQVLVSITVEKVVSSQNNTAELRWLLRDITRQKQLEDELAQAVRLHSLGILAGGIAHDLNNFLTIILGNLTLMKMYIGADNPAAGFIPEIEEGINQTGNLTQQLLTFAKGGEPLTKPVSISRLIQEAVDLALAGSNTNCVISLPQDLPAIEADPGQLTQVFTNLLLNAKQAMESGAVRIGAEKLTVADDKAVLALRPGDYMVVTIADEGAGIAPDILPRVFEPYFSTKEYGSGLGLSVCYSVMKKHSGHITVDSRQGKGTTFTLYLPVSQDLPEEEAEDALVAYGEGRVLVMDDTRSVRQTVVEMLTFLGYEVESAPEGGQAVQIYREAFDNGRPYDLVICDLTVRGGMGGKMTVAELRRIDPGVKAVVASGYSADVLSDYKKFGFVDVIAKPFRLQELSKVMDRVLHKSRNDKEVLG